MAESAMALLLVFGLVVAILAPLLRRYHLICAALAAGAFLVLIRAMVDLMRLD